MERKKKKLSTEDQLIETASEHEPNISQDTCEETLQRLFNKKYVYPKSDQWSLKSTSMFGRLIQSHVREQDAHACIKDSVMHTQHEHVTVSSKSAKENDIPDEKDFETEKLRLETCRETQQKDGTQLQDSSCENVEMISKSPKSPESTGFWSGETLSQSPQIKSPHFMKGRQRPPNKFRRKAAPVQRLLSKVNVTLPSLWQLDTLIAEREKLNVLKDKLSDKEMISWHQHTNFTNLAGKVVGEVKSQYGAELCTQAWCKFHEILSMHDVVPSSVMSNSLARLNSVHLCEAPGAFITSLNHYLVTKGVDTRRRWNWVGTTLNPYYEGNDTGRMISDDRFIRTTYSNWFFGKDNSGDLMNTDNMLALMERVDAMGSVHLVTADGSIDCQENPSEQEVIVSRLHHCEVLSSCLLLALGGTLVIKLFTMFEASSITLLYFLNCAFEKVCVCKPATSKSGNSEVYAVCSGYTSPLSRDALFSVFAAVCSFKDPHVVLLPREDIPDDFLRAHISCCLYFCQLQSETIEHNLHLSDCMTDVERKTIAHLQELCVDRYVSVCQLQQIDNEERIKPYGFKSNFTRFSDAQSSRDLFRKYRHSSLSPSMTGVGSSSVSLPLNRLHGTFHQRQQQNQFSWQEQLAQMQDYVVDKNAGQKIKRRHKVSEKVAQRWKMIYGTAFDSVASTQFCDCRLLGDLRMVLQHAKVTFHQQKALAQHSISTLTQAFHHLCYHQEQHRSKLHESNSVFRVFHLPLEDSLTSFCLPESPKLSEFTFSRLRSVEKLQYLQGVGRVGLVVDVTCPQWLGQEEVRTQRQLVEVVLQVCSYLQNDSSMALIMPVALTRLTAGLIYILGTHFQETSFVPSKESVFMHQVLIFHYFSCPSYTLLTLLEMLRQSFSSPSTPPYKPSFMEKAHGSTSEVFWEKDYGGIYHFSMSVDSSRKGYQDSCPFSPRLGSDGHSRCLSCRDEFCDPGSRCVTSCFKGTRSDCVMPGVEGMHDCNWSRQKPGTAGTVEAKVTVMENVPDRSESMTDCFKGDRRMTHDGTIVLLSQDVQKVTGHDLDSDGCVSQDVEMTPCEELIADDVKERHMFCHGDRRMSHNGVSMSARQDMQSVSTDDSWRHSLQDADMSSVHTCAPEQSRNPDNTDTLQNPCNSDINVKSCHSQGTNHKAGDQGIQTCSPTPSSHHNIEAENRSCDSKSVNFDTSHNGSSSSNSQSNEKLVLSNTEVSGSLSKDESDSKISECSEPCDVRGSVESGNFSSPCRHGHERGGGVSVKDSVKSGSCGHGGGLSGRGGLSGGRGVRIVPVEIVPVLDIINDVTFTRFLQASNGHSITRFLVTMKAAEQRLLKNPKSCHDHCQ